MKKKSILHPRRKGISKKTVFPEFYENLLIALAEVLKDVTPVHPKVKPNSFLHFRGTRKTS